MRIREVWIRFYKSFNFDYELKAHPKAEKETWQDTSDGWRPHVRIPLEPDITAVVGANESGKSHLLDAIRIVLTGDDLLQRDFCRYSSLFSVEQGKRLFPEVGATFELNDADTSALEAAGVPLLPNGDLLMLRPAPQVIEVLNEEGERVRLTDEQRAKVEARLPHAFLLDTQTDLPDSVSIATLAKPETMPVNRRRRAQLLSLIAGITTPETASTTVTNLLAVLNQPEDIDNEEQARQRLGRLLLTKVARIDESSFAELQQAIAQQREGLVNGLIQEMNKSIARHLNISKWWSQDEDFQLQVSPREHELVFTIRDRTGTDYSFSERSRGLTFFLSYYVQLRSHDRPSDRPEVLLMDEPDAYLSAVGQQDLLRVLENHARPEEGDRSDQVVYVTHSPFLINKNAGHRVRVVDKGTRDEGTRLVKDATQNHYEPLRTSLGASVAETAFIGGDNLFIEGISDQVLLADMNARAIRAETPPSQCLDLNQVTLVPGGSNVPYMLYLARGRDQYKPACAVLLDSDKTGREAHSQIKRGGAKGRPTVADDLIVMLGDWAAESSAKAEPGVTIEEPEDLIPLTLAGIAARRYAQHFLGLSQDEASAFTDDAIKAGINADNASMWDAVDTAFNATFETKIGKAGFAKELVAHLATVTPNEAGEFPEDITTLDTNFRSLLRKLAETLRIAREREDATRRDQRVERIVDAFAEDHPLASKRDDANMMLKRVDAAADDTNIGDYIRVVTARLRRTYELNDAPLSHVERFPAFLTELKEVPVQARLADKGRIDDEPQPVTKGGPSHKKAIANSPSATRHSPDGSPRAATTEPESTPPASDQSEAEATETTAPSDSGKTTPAAAAAAPEPTTPGELLDAAAAATGSIVTATTAS